MADYDLQYQDTHIDALLATANELKTAGYIYKGVATPSTNPGTPTERVAYLASEPGTYTNFGGIVITSGLYSLTFASGTWTGTQMSAGSDIEVVQTTGDSTTDVMSQKAVTDNISDLKNMITATDESSISFAGSTNNTRHDIKLPKGKLDIYISIPAGTSAVQPTNTKNGFELRIPTDTIVYQKSQKDFSSLTLPLELKFSYDSDGSKYLTIFERLSGSCNITIKGADLDISYIVQAQKKCLEEIQIEPANTIPVSFAGSTTIITHDIKLLGGYVNVKITIPTASAVQPTYTNTGFEVWLNHIMMFHKSQKEISSISFPLTLNYEFNGNKNNLLQIVERLNGSCIIEVSHRHSIDDRLWMLEEYKKDNKYIGKDNDVAYKSVNVTDAKWSVGVEATTIGRIKSVIQEYSSGTAWADFRICTYEDGSPITEDGKLFFCIDTPSVPNGKGIYAYKINTSKFEHIGEIVGFNEQGVYVNAIANHIMYNRMDGYWYIYTHLESPHYLYVSKSLSDPRYGVNYVTFSQLDYTNKTSGDEDSFVYYEKNNAKWILVYSKGADKICKQTSDYPDRDFKNAVVTATTTLTGPTITRVGGQAYIVCGSGSNASNDSYKVLDINSLAIIGELNLDYPTGGWRGWGTLIPIPEGLSTKYILLTFDRISSSSISQWTYGNIYMYEAVEKNNGYEYDIDRGNGLIINSNVSSDYSPIDLHFKRKFAIRSQYEDNIITGQICIKNSIFLENGNPYPILLGNNLNYKQFEQDIILYEAGILEILGGMHLVNSEYVLDLTDMTDGEYRYIHIWNDDEDLAKLKFRRNEEDSIEVYKDSTLLRTLNSNISKVRISFSGANVIFSIAK